MADRESQVYATLSRFVGRFLANAIIGSGKKKLRDEGREPDACSNKQLFDAFLPAARAFISDSDQRTEAEIALSRALHVHHIPVPDPAPSLDTASASTHDSITTVVEIHTDADILRARRACRELCTAVGFDETETVKTCTVVSELVRNILQYAGEGTVLLQKVSVPRPGVRLVARDEGPGIERLDAILGGTYRSKHGMGRGLAGSKAIMDEFDVQSEVGRGTRVEAVRYLLS